VTLPRGGDVFVREQAPATEAPPVVLLHGIATTGGLMWFATMSQLGEEFRVLAPDVRGHGRSSCDGRFRLADAADDVVGLLDGLDLDQAVVFGYSLGGTIAQLVAKRHPDRVRGLVLSATAARIGPRGLARLPMTALGRASSVAARVPLRRAWFRPFDGDEDAQGGAWSWFAAEMRGCHPQTIAEAIGELEAFDSRRWLPQLQMPSAVVVTRHDRVVPAASQRQLAELLPDPTVIEVESGHVAPGMAPAVFGPAALEACRVVSHACRAVSS
jgi:3-oxoadipate enol-lactonase